MTVDDDVAVTVGPLDSEIVADVMTSGASAIALAERCKKPFLLAMFCGDTEPKYREVDWSSSK